MGKSMSAEEWFAEGWGEHHLSCDARDILEDVLDISDGECLITNGVMKTDEGESVPTDKELKERGERGLQKWTQRACAVVKIWRGDMNVEDYVRTCTIEFARELNCANKDDIEHKWRQYGLYRPAALVLSNVLGIDELAAKCVILGYKNAEGEAMDFGHLCAQTIAEQERKRDPKKWRPDEWVEHLAEHPEDASQFDFEKLVDGECWAKLLVAQPQFGNCLSAGGWSGVLMDHPELIDMCDKKSEIAAAQWVKLLESHSQLVDACPIKDFSSSELEELFEKCTEELAGHIDWAYINSLPLEVRIKLASGNNSWPGERISFTKSEMESEPVKKMSADAMARLLNMSSSAREWFDERAFDWAGLSATGWVNLLWELPQYKEKCDVSKVDWSVLGRKFMLKALCFCPKGIVDYYDDWVSISHDEWLELVEHQPVLKRYMKKYDTTENGDGKGEEAGCQLGCLGTLLKLVFWCAVIWYGLSIGVSFVDYSKANVPDKARVVLRRASNDGYKVRAVIAELIAKVQGTILTTNTNSQGEKNEK